MGTASWINRKQVTCTCHQLESALEKEGDVGEGEKNKELIEHVRSPLAGQWLGPDHARTAPNPSNTKPELHKVRVA
jgi:hypothetical protein